MNLSSGHLAHAGHGGQGFCLGHALTSGHFGQTGGTILLFKTYKSSSMPAGDGSNSGSTCSMTISFESPSLSVNPKSDKRRMPNNIKNRCETVNFIYILD